MVAAKFHKEGPIRQFSCIAANQKHTGKGNVPWRFESIPVNCTAELIISTLMFYRHSLIGSNIRGMGHFAVKYTKSVPKSTPVSETEPDVLQDKPTITTCTAHHSHMHKFIIDRSDTASEG